jgi:cell division protein FtsI/penicillin-binding protein 2
MEEFKSIQEAVNSVLNIQSFIKRKQQRGPEKKKESFVRLINMIEETIVRSNIMFADLEMDMAKYDEKLQKALTRNEINHKILFQIMNY